MSSLSILNNLIVLNKSIYVTYVLKLLYNDTELLLIGHFSEVKQLHNRGGQAVNDFHTLLVKTNILIIQKSSFIYILMLIFINSLNFNIKKVMSCHQRKVCPVVVVKIQSGIVIFFPPSFPMRCFFFFIMLLRHRFLSG